MKLLSRLTILATALTLWSVGCLYPPATVPPADEQERTVIALPFDLTWDVVNKVARRDGLRVDVADPNHFSLEASGPRFTLQQADCGMIRSVGGEYAALPEPNSTSVYNFLVKPHGPEHTMVQVAVSYNSPIRVPLHPAADVDCISRGTDESRILREIIAEAKITQRPSYTRRLPAQAVPESHGGSTVLREEPIPEASKLYPMR